MRVSFDRIGTSGVIAVVSEPSLSLKLIEYLLQARYVHDRWSWNITTVLDGQVDCLSIFSFDSHDAVQ